MRHRLEYAPVWLLVRLVGALPRPLARAIGIGLAKLVYYGYGRLRRVGMRNLELAFPEKSGTERRRVLKGVYVSLGRQLAEFCLFPRLTRENAHRVIVYDGFENIAAAQQRGKGVIFLAAHFGAWELSSFFHSLQGYPVAVVVRALDNPHVDRLVTRYRSLHGNTVIEKQDFGRGMIKTLREGGAVGVLMDQNMTPPQGIFVDFFGHPACTAAGIAKVALRMDAAVVPSLAIWDASLRKYRMRFDPALQLVRTGDEDADIAANTQLFTKVVEDYARRYPEQWLWVHRRWKTRPPGEPPLY